MQKMLDQICPQRWFVDHMMPCKGGYESFKGHTKYHLRTQKKKEYISLQKKTVLNKWQGTVAKHRFFT